MTGAHHGDEQNTLLKTRWDAPGQRDVFAVELIWIIECSDM